MHEELKFQLELAKKYNYKKLPSEISEEVRNRYFKKLDDLNFTKGKIYSLENTLISNSYNRIVVGDYGAFIEISEYDIIKDNIKIKEGQEYRYSERYSLCKYYWLTAKDNSDVKIYHQKNKVSYADYIPNMYYISPYEIKVVLTI
jgi:hypothetical protein